MAGWPAQRPPWQVRIRRTPEAPPVGAGLLCTDAHVVTCAHVLTSSGEALASPVFVEFQFVGRRELIPASVIDDGWHPASPDGAGDVAVLTLAGPLPGGAVPAPLREAEGVWEHPFRAYGYPRGHERNGVWSRGVIVGPAEVEWLQLEADSSQGHPLGQGFSGAPIWDDQLGAVVGVVVTKDRDADARTGYGIPVEVISRYWSGLAPWVGWRLSHDSAMASHWGPRARGVERDSRPGWYFTGRRQALRELVDWLERQPADGSVRVVTGGPGSGKSAVLARLVALADPFYRARIRREYPAELADAASVPSLGRVSVAVHAAGLDLAQVTGRIADAVSSAADDPDTLIARVRERGRGLVVVVDALDEAVTWAETHAVATKLLVPLAHDAADVGVKVLVGTRPGPDGSFVRELGTRATVIDLDRERYFDLDDLAEYAARSLCLEFDPITRSPYRDDPTAAAQVARAIAEAAFPSFLVAGLTARAHAEDHDAIDVSVSGWRQQQGFPADVDMVMAAYLNCLDDPRRAFDLLVPVAYARQPGLPRDTLWAPLARAYSGRPYAAADVDWLLDTAASYLLEETDNGGASVVRLFHQALAEHIRSRTQPSMMEHTITTTLTERAEAAGGWLHAEHYARAHTASHAARAGGGLLDRLVTDPSFLLAADRRGLLRAFANVSDPEAQRAARCYSAAAHRLSGAAAADAAYLERESRRGGDDALADRIRGLGLPQPFITAFACRRPTDESLALEGHTGLVLALAWGTLAGAPVLASAGDDGTVRLWNPADGEQLRVLEGHTESVLAVTWSSLRGVPVLASASADGTVRLWDPADGTQLRALEGHAGSVWAVASGTLAGVSVLASAGADATVRLWDPADGVQVRVLEGHAGVVLAVAWGTVGGAPVLASAGADATVRLWDPADGTQLRALEGHSGWVRALAWGTLDGAPVLASAGLDGVDATVRLWNPAGGAQLRVLEGHSGGVLAVAWGTLDGAAVLASAGTDGTDAIVRLWDPAGGAQLRALEGHTAFVLAVAWRTLAGVPVLASAGADGTVRLWDPAGGAQLRALEGHTAFVSAVAWGSLDGAPALASAGADGIVRLWDPAGGTQVRVLSGHISEVWAVAWGTLDGAAVLASAGADAAVRLWDPAGGTQARVLSGHTRGVWALVWGTLDGAAVLASAGDDGTVRLWNPADGEQLRVLEGHRGSVLAVAWGSVNGVPVLASAGDDGTVRLWNPAGGAQLRVLEGHRGWVRALAWGSVDGAPVLASAGADGIVRLWDSAGGEQVQVLEGHRGWVWALSWGTLDGAPVLASAGLDGVDATVRLWDPRRPRTAVIDFVGPLFAVSISPDGWLGVAGWEGLAVLIIRAEAFANLQTA
ncbi:MAG: trypsin-like peptidase domain-containing protein [Egibacteraceae bacterium]